MQVSEIASHECESRVVYDVLFRIGVLVKTEQAASFAHVLEDFFRVSSASKRHVYVDASGMEVHSLDAFVEQDRYVVNLFLVVHRGRILQVFTLVYNQAVKLGISIQSDTIFLQEIFHELSTAFLG